jgi:Rrf2 family protein
MQITSRFTVAIHILTYLDYYQEEQTVTSRILADSAGVNPVIIRNVMSRLREAGMIEISKGKSGIRLIRPLEEIRFYDIWKAVDDTDHEGIFHFHEHPNFNCPVGRNIHKLTDQKLLKVQKAMEDEMKKITLDHLKKEAGN